VGQIGPPGALLRSPDTPYHASHRGYPDEPICRHEMSQYPRPLVLDAFGAAKLPFGDPFRSDVAVANAIVPQQVSGPFRAAVTLIGMGLIADSGLIAVGRSKARRGAFRADLAGCRLQTASKPRIYSRLPLGSTPTTPDAAR